MVRDGLAESPPHPDCFAIQPLPIASRACPTCANYDAQPGYTPVAAGRGAVTARGGGSAAGARADHEAVEGVFGNLPPQIFIRAIGLHRIDRLLEVGVLG